MTRIMLDEATLAKLPRVAGVVEVCDESGRPVGYFTPTADPAEYEGVECPVSDEELTRREREEPTSTTREVLDRLKTLEQG